MRFDLVLRTAAAVTAIATALPALAAECYLIIDRSNEVVYQGLTSPVDLSVDGKAARDALRARGEQLVAMDTDHCPPIDRARITGNGKPASVEEIVAGMRPAIPFGHGGASAPRDAGGISLPQIRVPVATGGPISADGPVSGMSRR